MDANRNKENSEMKTASMYIQHNLKTKTVLSTVLGNDMHKVHWAG